jgi:hypothetical protein
VASKPASHSPGFSLSLPSSNGAVDHLQKGIGSETASAIVDVLGGGPCGVQLPRYPMNSLPAGHFHITASTFVAFHLDLQIEREYRLISKSPQAIIGAKFLL